MANATDIDEMLEKARAAGNMVSALIIGTTETGQLQVFSHTADREAMCRLLDQVKEGLST